MIHQLSPQHFLLHSLVLKVNGFLCYNAHMILIVRNLNLACHLINWKQSTLWILYDLILSHVLVTMTIT